MESWRGRKAVLASRGEVDGPRVAECDLALARWRLRTYLLKEWNITPDKADALCDKLRDPGSPTKTAGGGGAL